MIRGIPLWLLMVDLVVLAAVSSWWWVALLRDLVSTRPGLLHTNPLQDVGRAARSAVLQGLLALLFLPHLAERLLGLTAVEVGATPGVALDRYGPATLWLYRAREGAEPAAPVLLVHSVVTTPVVFDLLPSRSLVGALLDAGHDVYLLDWGRPGAAQRMSGLAAYTQVIEWAEWQVRGRSGRAPHLIGYCAGGLLTAVLHSAKGTDGLASMTLIAAPVDTHVAGGMGAVVGSPYLMPVLALDGEGMVPANVIRASFRSLRPQSLTLVVAAWKARRDESARRSMAAYSRWAWDQPRVPGAMLFDLVRLFRSNALVRGELSLGGQRCDLRRLRGLPLLVVTTTRDHIVPPASTLAIRTVPGLRPDLLQCSAGHVSMLAGSEAARVLYPGLVDWLSGVQEPARPQPRA